MATSIETESVGMTPRCHSILTAILLPLGAVPVVVAIILAVAR